MSNGPGDPVAAGSPDEADVPDGTGVTDWGGVTDAAAVPDGVGVPVGTGVPDGTAVPDEADVPDGSGVAIGAAVADDTEVPDGIEVLDGAGAEPSGGMTCSPGCRATTRACTSWMTAILGTFLPGHACVVRGSSRCKRIVWLSIPRMVLKVARAASAFFLTNNPRPLSKASWS